MLSKFKGIKFSPIQEIFYTFKDERLYKFPVYKGGVKEWTSSDYKGYNGYHDKWTNATKRLRELYELDEQLSELETSAGDGQTGSVSNIMVR